MAAGRGAARRRRRPRGGSTAAAAPARKAANRGRPRKTAAAAPERGEAAAAPRTAAGPVRELTRQFPSAVPLALVLKKFLADRSLDHSYSGGLSSYCLVLLIIRFLQHEHHLGRPINQNLGSLLMDFLYFFGNVFDPRHMRISIQGSGIYLNRERGHSIDPIHIDDPLCPANNVGRNCFRIHQCIKAFADAFAVLENELLQFTAECDTPASQFSLLKKIMPSIDSDEL